MRAPFITSLLATAWFGGAGCTSAPQQDPPVASRERACANAAYDPLHMVSSKPDTMRDPDIESLLNQSADPRLAWVNRQMYLSLRSLDMELHREQRVAECEHPQSTQMLEARSGGGAGVGSVAGGGTADGGGALAGGGDASARGGGTLASGGSAPVGGVVAMTLNSGTGGASPPATASATSAASQSSIASGTAAGTARSTLVRKSSLTASGAGGNGAVAQKVSAGSDNDIVARRLRKAAEQETDPALRAKLWKEYTDFRQGMSAR
ncbi:MAG TPA: hypothetical protein VH209_01080 [Steroidobacteraceae bacterium]|jgi:hypothetical protein|nr:hypothetical protein [Steroidobacteraceae bacterium]